MSFAIVVPTLGRASLGALLDSLAACTGPRPDVIVVVDDRRDAGTPLAEVRGWPAELIQMRRGGGRGPAAARNVGWRAADSDWVVFLDDDVRLSPSWLRELAADLDRLPADVAASQGRIRVPLPNDRPPTDVERGTAGLAAARWITADIAYRRAVLGELGGFDERFPRAFREDADLALRAIGAGHRLVVGHRVTAHPVRSAPWHVSISQQRGNADDALMRAVHGRTWYRRAGASRGRRRGHVLTTAAALTALASGAAGRRGPAAAAAAVWAGLTAGFAWARIAPGPRTPREVTAMVLTSVAIPPLAVAHLLRGTIRHRGARAWSPLGAVRIRAVLLDRDGTLIHDVPYNGDPKAVAPVPGAAVALDRLRGAGLKVGVVTNQSGIARGLLTQEQVAQVNARVEALLGPFDTWQVCPHSDEDGCTCRKPQPGLVRAAAAALGVPVDRCVVIGDTASDVASGRRAGAATVLVPNGATRPNEVLDAPMVCRDLGAAADRILAGTP